MPSREKSGPGRPEAKAPFGGGGRKAPAGGLVFDVKRFAIHDGPGIRTTLFFKGCPLRCPWCHNPESLLPRRELVFHGERCLLCRACLEACPTGAASLEPGKAPADGERCNLSGACVEACPPGAREILGRWITLEEALAELERDRVFFQESGGGVTFSGGEPLAQADFLESLLSACRERGLHTALDTTLFAPPEVVGRMLPLADLWLVDLKHMDSRVHRRFTGVPNEGILENLRLLASRGGRIFARIPLVPGFNDSRENLEAAADFLREMGEAVEEVDLLPYHKGGVHKLSWLPGRPGPWEGGPAGPGVEEALEIFRSRGFETKRGG